MFSPQVGFAIHKSFISSRLLLCSAQFKKDSLIDFQPSVSPASIYPDPSSSRLSSPISSEFYESTTNFTSVPHISHTSHSKSGPSPSSSLTSFPFSSPSPSPSFSSPSSSTYSRRKPFNLTPPPCTFTTSI